MSLRDLWRRAATPTALEPDPLIPGPFGYRVWEDSEGWNWETVSTIDDDRTWNGSAWPLASEAIATRIAVESTNRLNERHAARASRNAARLAATVVTP